MNPITAPTISFINNKYNEAIISVNKIKINTYFEINSNPLYTSRMTPERTVMIGNILFSKKPSFFARMLLFIQYKYTPVLKD